MKKFVSVLLVFAMLCGLCACGDTTTPTTAEESPSVSSSASPTVSPSASPSGEAPSEEDESSDVPKLSLGEMASTDIVDFTLDNAVFSVYVNPTGNDDYLMPVEETDNTIYSASVGHSLVVTTFTVKNKDRSGHLDLGNGYFGIWSFMWNVLYHNEEYPLKGFDLNDKDGSWILEMYPAAIIDRETGHMLFKNETNNYLLDAGDEISVRTFGVIGVEPDALTDGFELTVNVPNSSGEYENFTYMIPATSVQ